MMANVCENFSISSSLSFIRAGDTCINTLFFFCSYNSRKIKKKCQAFVKKVD